LTSLSLIFIDPYVTNYLLKEEINLKLPKSFWKILTGTCGSTLRLLSVGNVEVDPRHLLVAVQKLENLESLELQGGWYGAIPYIPLKCPKIPMKKLHHLHAYIIEALPGLTFPALQNTFVSSNMTVFELDAFGWKIGRLGLTRFTYCGPTVDIFELCFRFPNMQHFAVHKLRNSHFSHIEWQPHISPMENGVTPNGSIEEMTGDESEESVPNKAAPNHATTSQVAEPGTSDAKRQNTMAVIYSLRSITIYHYHPWPFGRSILDNILGLCKLRALPGLEEVKYVEHDGWVRRDSNMKEVENVLSEIEHTFESVGVRFISERRCLNLD